MAELLTLSRWEPVEKCSLLLSPGIWLEMGSMRVSQDGATSHLVAAISTDPCSGSPSFFFTLVCFLGLYIQIKYSYIRKNETRKNLPQNRDQSKMVEVNRSN